MTAQGNYSLSSKETLRHAMRACRKTTHDPKESQIFFESIQALPEWNEAQILLTYIPLLSEPDTSLLIDEALRIGKTVAIPRLYDEGIMEYGCITENWRKSLVSGKNRILEPSFWKPLARSNQNTLILVPGLAFTISGERLGRGKGYYDRYFSQTAQNWTLCGVCYAYQIKEEIFSQTHDVKMNLVVTEQQVYRCS